MKITQRRCLAWDEAFLSWGPANRLCQRCRRANDVEEHIPEAQGVDDDRDLYVFLCPHRRRRAHEATPAAARQGL
jgi:hypothetical protein